MTITRTIHFRDGGIVPAEMRKRPKARVLVENGRWSVPVEDRPVGWEFMMPNKDVEVPLPGDGSRT
jgi:hypothetical protein